MEKLLVSRDVYCCEVYDGAIFLDLRSNNYHGVPASGLKTLRHQVVGWPCSETISGFDEASLDSDDDEVISTLVASDLLTKNPARGHIISANSVHPNESLGMRHRPRRAYARSNGLAIVRAWLAVVFLLKAARLRYLIQRLIQCHRALEKTKSSFDVNRAIELALIYVRVRPWLYRAREHCLLDSLVLTRFLATHGISSTLVIGVATRPFTAHAWVQAGPVVLNDKVEYVSMYTPILSA